MSLRTNVKQSKKCICKIKLKVHKYSYRLLCRKAPRNDKMAQIVTLKKGVWDCFARNDKYLNVYHIFNRLLCRKAPRNDRKRTTGRCHSSQGQMINFIYYPLFTNLLSPIFPSSSPSFFQYE